MLKTFMWKQFWPTLLAEATYLCIFKIVLSNTSASVKFSLASMKTKTLFPFSNPPSTSSGHRVLVLEMAWIAPPYCLADSDSIRNSDGLVSNTDNLLGLDELQLGGTIDTAPIPLTNTNGSFDPDLYTRNTKIMRYASCSHIIQIDLPWFKWGFIDSVDIEIVKVRKRVLKDR